MRRVTPCGTVHERRGGKAKINLSTSSGGLSSETSILFHSISHHTTNSETLLQQQIQGHQQMKQQQLYTTENNENY
jgi:hypothetical protein